MGTRLLHSVVDQLLELIEQRPEFSDVVSHFVFDENREIRAGVADIRTRDGAPVAHADGSMTFNASVELLASRPLIEFAHAVANGVVPCMPLCANAAD